MSLSESNSGVFKFHKIILSVVCIPYVSLDSNLMQLPSTTGSVGKDKNWSMNIVH